MKQSRKDRVRALARIGIWKWMLAAFFILLGISGTLYRGAAGQSVRFGTTAAFAAQTAPEIWPQDQSDLKPDPNLVFGRLPNGFRYVLMQNKTPLKRVSMHLVVQAGSLNETDDQQGYAHFLEHLEFCGSAHFKPGELVHYFQRIGMDFGADANARTGFTDTVYDVLLPDGTRQSLADALKVMRDFADGALLLPEEIDRERKVVLAEKRTRDSASYRTFEASLKFSFPESLISRRLPIGVESVLDKADHASLKRFYDTWYRPETMILVAVGDMDTSECAELIKEAFDSLAARAPAAPAPDLGNIDRPGTRTFYHYEAESGNTEVSAATVYTVPKEPDTSQFEKEEALRDMSDAILQNRLSALVRKPGAPFTTASVHSGRFLKNVFLSEMAAQGDPENWQKSLSTIEQQLRSALEYGFSKDEVDRVRADYLTELDDQEKKAGTRNSQAIARQIISDLEENQVTQSPAQQKALLAPIVSSAAGGEILQALKSIWSRDQRLVELTGNEKLPETGGLSPENQVLAVWDQSLKTAVSAPEENRPVSFPYLPVPDAPGKIRERRDITDLGIVQVDFENGIRLNLKKTDFKQNQVVASLIFGGGSASQPMDKPGLSQLTDEVVQESGLGGLNREELDRALAGKSTRIWFDVGEDRFTFRAGSVSGEIPLLFQLLYAHMLDPGFRPEAYDLSMDRFSQMYQEFSRTVDGMARLHARRFFSGGDPRFGLPDYESFRKLTLKDVQDWLAPPLRKDAVEVSIAGDMDVETVLQLAALYLGNLPKRSADFKEPPAASPRFPDGGALNLTVATNIPKALVIVAYPTADFWDIARTRRLSVLADVFSDRLREDVRMKLGAAYSPVAFNHPSRAYPGYGVFQSMITVDPKDVKKVTGAVESIGSALSEKPVTDDELRRSLDPILTGIKDLVRTNDYWVNSVLTGCAAHPQQIEWSRTIQKDYAAVTVQDIFHMAHQYLGSRKPAVIVIQPGSGSKTE